MRNNTAPTAGPMNREVSMPFPGRYAGQFVEDVPTWYLRNFLKFNNPKPDLAQAIADELEYRDNYRRTHNGSQPL